MKLLCTLLGAGISTLAAGQVVHAPNAPTTLVNWQQMSAADTLALDVDGDNAADVTFKGSVRMVYLPNDSPAMQVDLSVRPRHNGTQLAADSVVTTSAHRFQAEELIRHGLQWTSYGFGNQRLALFYYYGSPNSSGFFWDGTPGYIALRKRAPNNSWNYWWIRLATRQGSNQLLRVELYGSSQAPALATSNPGAALQPSVYPNPSTSNWILMAAGNSPYQLYNSVGQLVSCGTLAGNQPTVIDGQQLPAGLYILRYYDQGAVRQQRLVRR